MRLGGSDNLTSFHWVIINSLGLEKLKKNEKGFVKLYKKGAILKKNS